MSDDNNISTEGIIEERRKNLSFSGKRIEHI